MKHVCYILIYILVISCAGIEKNPREITIVGTGKMKIVPDMVDLTIRAHYIKPTMKEAVKETQNAMNEVYTVCKKYISSEADVRTSSIATNKAYEYTNTTERFVGYEASQTINVSIKDLKRIESFTEELLATKISSLDNLVFLHSQTDSIMREVNLLALEDATQTAERMCKKMNVKRGKVISISNFKGGLDFLGLDPCNRYDLSLYSKGFGGQAFKINPEILEFRNSVYVSFEID